jgi:hypothetical protein
MDELNDLNKTQLKQTIMRMQCDKLQKEISGLMVSIETKCNKYRCLMDRLHESGALSDDQQASHDELVQKLAGHAQSNAATPANNSVIGTVDIGVPPPPVTQDAEQIAEICASADSVLDLGGNDAIWNRIQAAKKMKKV